MGSIDISYLGNPEKDPVQVELKMDNFGCLYFFNPNDSIDGNISIDKFLGLTDYEKNLVSERKKEGYYLLGDKQIGGDYPDYFKKFHRENIKLFNNSSEITEYRDLGGENGMFPNRKNRELIFVRIDIQKTALEEISEETLKFKNAFERILGDLKNRFI